MSGPVELQVVMPVFNEGASIERTLREWHEELSPRLGVELVVAEDGSRDDTKAVLARLAEELPLRLDMSEARRGYGGAVMAALRATTAPYVLAVDSDGQCDPRDLWPFWEARADFDAQIGWRVARRDSALRKGMSRAFGILHAALFGTGLHDPSCPYVLMSRAHVERLLPEQGTLSEAFWWEFVARSHLAGARMCERPVGHRLRASGTTVVYKPSRVPGIAWRNGSGLLRLWWEKRR
jgi:dolichol-phosphate mannosyltransferase